MHSYLSYATISNVTLRKNVDPPAANFWLSVLLRPLTATLYCQGVRDFAEFFVNKVADIRSATFSALPAVTSFRQTSFFFSSTE